MKALTPLALLTTLGLLAAPASGDDPDLIEIITKADRAADAVKAASYRASVWVGGEAPVAQPRIEATVKVREGAQRELPLLRVDGRVKMPGSDQTHPFQLVLNEKQAASFDREEKVCTVGELPEGLDLVSDALTTVVMREFVVPGPFSDELEADERRYEGKQTVGGTECHVVYVVYKGGMAQARWYFGVDDALPHRVDRIARGSDGKVYRALELRELDASAKLDEATFAIQVPADFERREYTRPARTDPGLLKVGSAAPDWTLKNPAGQAFTLSQLRGKVVLLDFWATWCGPCKVAMPKVQKLHERYQGKPVVVLGINTWERSDAAAYMKKNKFTYELLLNGDRVAEAYGVRGIPTFYIIGPDGKILHASSGFSEGTEASVARLIDAALAGME
jgi:thiol-disulfide isomerase/thioredoxin